MNGKSQISIVVPIYNKEEHLEKCLESITTQSFENIEVLLVDDGSTDGCSDICAKFTESDERFNYIYQDNLGLSGARNTGIRLAKSDWITFHDADDLMAPTGLQNVFTDAMEYNADIAAGVFERQNGLNKRIDKVFQEFRLISDFKNDEDLARKYCTHFSCGNKIYKKKVFDKHIFQPGLYMQDIDLWLRLMTAEYTFLQTEHIFATYVAHEGSESRQRNDLRFESLFILINGLDEYYQSKGLSEYHHIWQFALLQGAIAFFAKWKLDDNDVTDLDRIRDVLGRITEQTLEDFFNFKNKGNIIPILVSIRDGNYDLARKSMEVGLLISGKH